MGGRNWQILNYNTYKKPRLKSNTRQSGYEPDLNPQTKNPTNVGLKIYYII